MTTYRLTLCTLLLLCSSATLSMDRQTLLEEAALDIMCDTESFTSCMEIEVEACKVKLDACVQELPENIAQDEIGDAYFQIEQCFLGGIDIPEEQIDRCHSEFVEHLDAVETGESY